MAGAVQTLSIRDCQVDYFTIVRESATSYHIALTVDPTPLYRIELTPNSTKIGDVQMFSAADNSLPIAAARFFTDSSKKKPCATFCTSSPTDPSALWRPVFFRSSFLLSYYSSETPIVTVPGRPAVPHLLAWRDRSSPSRMLDLWWEGPGALVPSWSYRPDERGFEYVFATFVVKTTDTGDNLLQLRRGGGMEFELSVILQLFTVLHFLKEQLN
jgi:hypothetical protein